MRSVCRHELGGGFNPPTDPRQFQPWLYGVDRKLTRPDGRCNFQFNDTRSRKICAKNDLCCRWVCDLSISNLLPSYMWL